MKTVTYLLIVLFFGQIPLNFHYKMKYYEQRRPAQPIFSLLKPEKTSCVQFFRQASSYFPRGIAEIGAKIRADNLYKTPIDRLFTMIHHYYVI